jgi:hypothetical protein
MRKYLMLAAAFVTLTAPIAAHAFKPEVAQELGVMIGARETCGLPRYRADAVSRYIKDNADLGDRGFAEILQIFERASGLIDGRTSVITVNCAEIEMLAVTRGFIPVKH